MAIYHFHIKKNNFLEIILEILFYLIILNAGRRRLKDDLIILKYIMFENKVKMNKEYNTFELF